MYYLLEVIGDRNHPIKINEGSMVISEYRSKSQLLLSPLATQHKFVCLTTNFALSLILFTCMFMKYQIV